MTAHDAFARAIFPGSICIVLVLALGISGCSSSATPEARTFCGGGWPDLDKAIEEAEEGVDFGVLVPTYLPATTSSIMEANVHPRDEIAIFFYPCPNSTSDILGPLVEITETTLPESLPEPGDSDPPTKRIQIRGKSALIQQGASPDTASIAIGWQQRGLSMLATLIWQSNDAGAPEMTPQMEMEALRVVESVIEQGESG